MPTLELREPFLFPQPVERPSKVSQTQLQRLDSCPYSLALYYRYGGGGQSHAMARGEAFHEFAQLFVEMLTASKEDSAPGEIGRDLMGEVIDKRSDLVLPAHEQDALRAMAYNFAESTAVQPETIVALETMYELELGEWTVRGKIDYAQLDEGVLWVCDYKTSLAIPSQDQLVSEREDGTHKVIGKEAFQLLFYALLLTQGHAEGTGDEPIGGKAKDVLGSLVFPRYRDKQTGGLVTRSIFIDHIMISDFKRTLVGHLKRLDEYLETNRWPAVAGSHCSTCPAPKECPIPAHLKDTVIDSPEAAKRVAETHMRQQEREKESLKALREYAKEAGPIEFGDFVWDFTLSESRVVKDKSAFELALENGEPIDLSFYSTRKSTRFSRRKQSPNGGSE